MKTKWNLKQLFPEGNIEKYTKEKVKAWTDFATKYKADKSFLESPEKLKLALDEYCELSVKVDTHGLDNFYYRLATDLDLNNDELKQKEKVLNDGSLELSNKLEFFPLELGKVSKEKQSEFLKVSILSEYRHFLERLFKESKHFLPEKSEQVIRLLSTSSFSNWVKMVDELLNTEKASVHDKDGKINEISFSQLIDRLKNPYQVIRKEACEQFNKILERYLKVSEYEINSILDTKKVVDDLRGYKYPEEANHLANDVSTDLVDKLVEEVSERNDISHRFYELRAKLMGKKKLEYYERDVPYGAISKTYTFEEAYEKVVKTYENLDGEFKEKLEKYFDNGLVDVFPKIGKVKGAYCSTNSISSPSFILLNFNNGIYDITTIAHEIGHSINYELMRDVKTPLYYDNSSIVLEVASNFFEDFVCDEISKDLSKEEQLGLLMERLGSDIASIQRQIACYKFEKDLHREYRKRKYLSHKEIGVLFLKRMKEYMGDFVDDPEYAHNWWLYWSHIRTFFYVYSYASGSLISKYMQRQVRKDKKWIEQFKIFLRSGSKDSPENTLKSIGIDIKSGELWKEGLIEMDEMLTKAENLAKELGKI